MLQDNVHYGDGLASSGTAVALHLSLVHLTVSSVHAFVDVDVHFGMWLPARVCRTK